MNTFFEDEIIRPLSTDDLRKNKYEIIKLLDENYRININNMDNSLLAEEKYTEMVNYFENGAAILLGAFRADEICGFLWAYPIISIHGKTMHLNHIIIKSNYRNHGIGEQLVEKVCAIAIELQCEYIELNTTVSNQNAVTFYKNRGFKVERVLMQKKIGEANAN